MPRRRVLIGFGSLAVVSLVLGGVARRELRARGLSLVDFANELRQGDELRFEWRSIDGKHWQIVAPTSGEAPAVGDIDLSKHPGCPDGMVRVTGAFRWEGRGSVTGEVERIQDAACVDWISREFPARCRVFDREKLAKDIERIPTQPMDYCIDRFEYPNVAGEYPVIVATYREAAALCKKEGKRLCTENEWTFACEGEEARPYPYGWERDDTACVVDRPWRAFTEGALQPRNGDRARRELDRLWQGEPSGSRPACRSPFGVYDMTGNVDEWTTSVNKTGYVSILKGGYWGPVRARCRPSTRAHGEDFVAYQQSFRCCADPSPTGEGEEEGEDAGVRDAPEIAPAAEALDADASSAVAQAPEVSLQSPEEDDDELEAIARERASGCSAAPGGAAGGGFGIALVAAALAASRRARRS